MIRFAEAGAGRMLLVWAVLGSLLGGRGVVLAAPEPSAAESPLGTAANLLATTPATEVLRAGLDEHGVSVVFAPLAPGLYARYSLARRTIEIDQRWSQAAPATLAAVIAHEAVHVQDAVSGYLASGGTSACIDSEIRAFHVSAQFWLQLYGPSGKADAADDLERQFNLVADREARDPASLEQVVRETYRSQCSAP